MQPETDQGFLLVALAPFIAAAMAPAIRRLAGHYAGWVLAVVPAAIFLELLGYVEAVAAGGTLRIGLPWIAGIGPRLDFSFYLDGLSLVFALLISGIGTAIIAYSGGYLAGHPHQGRFLAFMLAFMGSMLGLVLADSVATLFVFWELTTITSFLLIGFDHARQAARRGAIQALIVTGGGGLALLAGLVMLGALHGNWSIADMLSRPGFVQNTPRYLPILILVLAGAFTKSAQVPFHFWLPNAMEAPTPVSAFLHSATMVKAGVYLLARMNPVLGGTVEWQALLVIFGGATLLAGAVLALRHTDMKQMLAYTTLGTLGLLTLLIGVGTQTAIIAMVLFLIAHAFYKGALFLVAGTIEHETGTRDITQVSGLARKMPVSAASALLAAISMAGIPVALGYYAKDEIHALVADPFWPAVPAVIVAVIGNALMLAVGAAIALKVFFGPLTETPKPAREGPFSLIIGPLVLGIAGIAAGVFIAEFGRLFVAATASGIAGERIAADLQLFHVVPVLLALSVVTWGLGGLVVWGLDDVRTRLRRLAQIWRWGPDQGFDQAMVGLIRLAARLTRLLHHGSLEGYMTLIVALLAAATLLPLLLQGFPALPPVPDMASHEWGIVAVAAIGLFAVVVGRTRLIAIVALGIQGLAVAVIFLLFGAPDLSFTQFMVEVLSVVILALVMTRLHLDQRDMRVFEDAVRDGALALLAGGGIAALMIVVLASPLDLRLSDFFAAHSVPLAHGHNIVNVILVDFRALDTLGEITVVMAAGVAILALIRIPGLKRAQPRAPAAKRAAPRRKRAAKSAAGGAA